jgi:hypothetical protein
VWDAPLRNSETGGVGEGLTKRRFSLTHSVGEPSGAEHPSLLLAVHIASRPPGTDTNSKQVKFVARGSEHEIPLWLHA